MRYVCLMILGLAVLTVAGASAAHAATPTILVQSANPISTIDASSKWLVWRQWRQAGHASCSTVVTRRLWTTGQRSNVFTCKPSRVGEEAGAMALAVSSVVWTTEIIYANGCCNATLYDKLRTADMANRDSSSRSCGGNDILNLAAHTGLAVYTKTVWTSVACPGNPDSPVELMTGGDVRTLALTGGNPVVLAGAPPARYTGVSTTRIALVPYDVAAAVNDRYPPPMPEIQVWGRGSRLRERMIPETGVITAMAISGDQIAVMVDDGSGNLRIDRFSASTGVAQGSTPVAKTAAPMLAVYYNWIVYVAGRSVIALNTATGKAHTVATPTYTPRQIFAVRGKAVWESNGGAGRSRILTAPLA